MGFRIFFFDGIQKNMLMQKLRYGNPRGYDPVYGRAYSGRKCPFHVLISVILEPYSGRKCLGMGKSFEVVYILARYIYIYISSIDKKQYIDKKRT